MLWLGKKEQVIISIELRAKQRELYCSQFWGVTEGAGT